MSSGSYYEKETSMNTHVEPKKIGRPLSRKALLTLRLEQEVVDHFRTFGKGWLANVNDALKKVMKQEQARAEKKASAARVKAVLDKMTKKQQAKKVARD